MVTVSHEHSCVMHSSFARGVESQDMFCCGFWTVLMAILLSKITVGNFSSHIHPCCHLEATQLITELLCWSVESHLFDLFALTCTIRPLNMTVFSFQYLKERKKGGKYSMISGKRIKMKVKKSKKDKQVSLLSVQLIKNFASSVWMILGFALFHIEYAFFSAAGQKSRRASWVPQLYLLMALWTPEVVLWLGRVKLPGE